MGSPSITTRELSKAIGREVSRFTARPVRGAPHGYMADIYRLELSGVDVPGTLIMKVASSDPKRRAIAERFGSYQNEQHFYTSLNQNLPFRVPHCYHSAGDRFLLLLEDLGDQGIVSAMDGASREQAELAIQTLAKIHGHFCLHPPKLRQTIEVGLRSAVTDMQTFVLHNLEQLEDTPARRLAAHYAADSDDYIHLYQRQNQVFTHLDYRLDNLRFSDDLIVLDWGESTHAPAGFDLANFLVSSLTIENRRSWEAWLLATYRETLGGFGISESKESVLNTYRTALLPTLYLPGLILAHGDKDEGTELAARNLTAIEDHLPYLASVFT